MSTFLKVYCTSALSLLLGTTAGFADVTNANVWENWQGYMTSMGYEVSANESVSGNVLTITDVKMTMDFALGNDSMNATMPEIQFTEQGDGSVGITAPEKTMLESVNSALSEEYATRKETVQRRAWLTVQAFGQSARLVKGNCAPQITSLFSKRAGFGANGDAVGDDGDESENENDDALPVTSKVSLADAWDCRVADLARGTYWDFPKSKHCLPIHD